MLENSEERFRSVVETANDAIICIDSHGNIDSWNQAATKSFGYSGDEALGKPLTVLMPERFRDDYQSGMNRMVATGKSSIIGKTVDMAGLRKDGSEFPIELSVAAWKTKQGMFFTGIVRDVTDRKLVEEALRKARDELEQLVRERTAELVKANEQLRREIEDRKRVEEALRDTNELLEKIFSTTHLLIAYMDTDFNFIRVNHAYAATDGHEPEFFVGKNHFDLYPHEGNESIFGSVVEKGEPHTAYARPFEYAEHPERGVTYWDWTLHPVKKVSGKVEGLVLGLVNVTERIKTEEALRESQKRYKGLWDGAPIAYHTLDTRGIITHVNQTETNMLGYTRDEMVGKPIFEFILPEQRKEAEERFRLKLAGEHIPRHDNRIYVKKNGSKINVSIDDVLERDSNGKVTGVRTTMLDVTEQKQAEEALKESEERLRFLSSQLLTAQENERKRIAQELHDSIGQSLTAIKFGLENSLDQRAGCTAEARVESLEAVIPLVQQAIEEVRRIHTDLRPSMLDDLGILATINWFCREFQMIYSDVRIEKQVDVQENEVPESLKMVIFRVLQEAMNNIAKHSDADLVRLCFKKTDATTGLTIEDNGRGFDLQGALSLNSPEKGFGITSMKERTELAGGSFAIESTPGTGTVVRASWPYNNTKSIP